MVKVEMPRASWDSVIELLRNEASVDWPRDPNPYIVHLMKEISDQLDSQEY